MVNEWDEHAGGWDSDPDVGIYADKAFRCLTELLPVEGLRVLDFGCGTGPLTERIAPLAKRVVSLDTSPGMLAQLAAKRLPNVDTVAGELTAELAAENALLLEGFDLVVASSVCGFVPDYPGTVAVFASLLKPGGHVVQWDWHATAKNGHRGLTEQAIRDAYAGAGLEDTKVDMVFSAKGKDALMDVLMGVGRKR